MPTITAIYRTGSKRHFTVALDCGHKHVIANAAVQSLQLFVGKAHTCADCTQIRAILDRAIERTTNGTN